MKIKTTYYDEALSDADTIRMSNELLYEYNDTLLEYFNENMGKIPEKFKESLILKDY